jgi:ABC-type sugar transport system permease subunit
MNRTIAARPRKLGRQRRLTLDDATPYLMVIPALICIGFVSLYPSVRSIFMSFFDINLLKHKTPFVGLSNYAKFFSDATSVRVLFNTFFWSVCSVTFGTIIAMFTAVQLNKPFRGRAMFRSLFMAPWVTPPIVVASIWAVLLNRDLSPINGLLMRLGLTETPIAFLADPAIFLGFLSKPMLYLIVINLWNMQPFMVVMFLAGLQTVPQELYEAATVDGASKTRQFWHITLPLLAPVMETTLLLQCIWQFNNFNLSYLVTKGGPLNTTELLAVRVYTEAMTNFKYGYGAAISVVMVLVTLVPALMYINRVIHQQSELVT